MARYKVSLPGFRFVVFHGGTEDKPTVSLKGPGHAKLATVYEMDADSQADAIWRFNKDLGIRSTSREHEVVNITAKALEGPGLPGGPAPVLGTADPAPAVLATAE